MYYDKVFMLIVFLLFWYLFPNKENEQQRLQKKLHKRYLEQLNQQNKKEETFSSDFGAMFWGAQYWDGWSY